jgi:hypothetical protein
MTDVRVNERVEIPLLMTNLLTSSDLVIQEIYSTDPYVSLKWPCGDPIDQKFDLQGNALPVHESSMRSEYLKIPTDSRTHIVSMVFQVN